MRAASRDSALTLTRTSHTSHRLLRLSYSGHRPPLLRRSSSPSQHLSVAAPLCCSFAVFEKSLQCTFSTLDEYLELFLTRVDGLWRRMASTGEEDLLDYKIIGETFQRASDYLSPHLKNTEGLLHLHAYWVHLETKLGKVVQCWRRGKVCNNGN